MSWTYTGDGEEVIPPPDGADAAVWRWTLVREGDGSEKRTIEVWISGTAMSSSNVPEVVENARQSRGQNVVARILDWEEPPVRVVLGTNTEKPTFEGGEPGAEVRELNEVIEWFDDRGLVLMFTARGTGTGPNPTIHYDTHSANVLDLEDDKLVLRVESHTKLEAARGAKAQWLELHPDLPPPEPPKSPVATTEQPRERLREFGVHLSISETSEGEDTCYVAMAYDDDGHWLGIAVAPTLDDVWLTIADDVLPDGDPPPRDDEEAGDDDESGPPA